MRAAYFEELGGPEVLRVGEMPDPTCGPNDVLIRVRASSLDRLDVFSREGSHGVKRKLPHIGGRDIAGHIVAMGSEVTGRRFPELQVGQSVVAKGDDGAHAELAIAPALTTSPLPSNISLEQAAAIPTAGRRAYDALVNRARVQAGEDV